MLNAEKLKDEIIEEYQNLLNKTVIDGDGNRMNKAIKTIAYKHCGKQLCGASSTFKWLCEEYKEPVKLTRFEYFILDWLLNSQYVRYIARDRNGNLYAHINKPCRVKYEWRGNVSAVDLTIFGELFAFVKWQNTEPTPIKDVLENCEVVDDAEE